MATDCRSIPKIPMIRTHDSVVSGIQMDPNAPIAPGESLETEVPWRLTPKVLTGVGAVGVAASVPWFVATVYLLGRGLGWDGTGAAANAVIGSLFLFPSLTAIAAARRPAETRPRILMQIVRVLALLLLPLVFVGGICFFYAFLVTTHRHLAGTQIAVSREDFVEMASLYLAGVVHLSLAALFFWFGWLRQSD